jgi:hypothetical protein
LAAATPRIAELAKSFVCVRVTDLRTLDLFRWRLDFDLTFSALVADPQGRVLHRYGGRDAASADSFLSLDSFTAFVEGALERAKLEASAVGGVPQMGVPRRTIEASPTFKTRDAQKRIDCVHCHTVNDFEWRDAEANQRVKPEQRWPFPDLARLGLEVERDRQRIVARVAPDGPAGKAGLKAGDRLDQAAAQPLLTRADLQWALHQLPAGATTLQIETTRDGAARKVAIALPDGWKECDAREYAWRPMKWNLEPAPGFGGKALAADEKQALGLPAEAWAVRVGYLVDWGEKAATGRSAAAAGLRKGDVVVSVAGESRFDGEEHFQAWFRLTQKAGTKVAIEVLRDGKRSTLSMAVVE